MRRLAPPLIVTVAFVASALGWSRLPERAPIHWNAAGEIDRYGGRFEVALLMPLMMLAIWGLMRVLPRIDPRRENYAKMAGTYDLVVSLALASMLAIHLAVLASAFGYEVPMGRITPLIVGAVFIVLGNVLPRARPNWWFGIRTPWTLSNDRVWTRTHRVGGYAMLVAGVALATAAFLPPQWVVAMMIVAITVGAIVPIAYSYFAWRQETTTR